MLVDLVRVRTADGVRLDGAQREPAEPLGRHPCLDAVICLPGVGGNFYGSTLMTAVTEPLLQEGLVVLHVNTRGHDGVSTAVTDRGGQLEGAAFEAVDDCQHDVYAWADFLAMQGFQRIALLGHSLGAIKAMYAQAHRPHESVARIVAVSPPRLSHQRFLQGAQATTFRQSLAMAQRLMDRDEPRTLFRSPFPFPLIISAATFMDKYGPEERYNFLRFAPGIDCPITFLYGGLELTQGSAAFEDLLSDIKRSPWPSHRPPVTVVDGADHFYSGLHDELAREVRQALRDGP
jgi:pimeloyl-ACP methyl ester carboxylesterase